MLGALCVESRRRVAARCWLFPLVLFSLNPTLWAADSFHIGDGMSASVHKPAIPEPMVFDLVRPLGASRGEAEINTLAERNLGNGSTAWAPELEFMVLDGLGIEFEFPFEDLGLEEWKLATQLTLGTTGDGAAIHGLQMIGRIARKEGRDSVDLLYLLGVELGKRWSMLTMFGARREGFGDGEFTGLVNASVFYEYSPRISLGLETNWEIDEQVSARASVIPQLHLDIDRHVTMQFGVGANWLDRSAGMVPMLIGRFIYAF